MTMQREELEESVGKSVRKEMGALLNRLGVDESDYREIWADFTYLRRWRKSAEQMQSYTMKTVITAVVAGAVGALWLGFKTILALKS
jgi:hypothetical protein